MKISPVYQMELIEKVEKEIWDRYKYYKKVEQYIKLNQETDTAFFNEVDFQIIYSESSNIDLSATLANILEYVPEKLISMAIDLGIETPDFIPSIPTFRNKIKDEYQTASISFEKAFQNVEKDPAETVGQINSVFESIMKEILNDYRFSDIASSNSSSKKLVDSILKSFDIQLKDQNLPTEIRTISSSLISIAKAIEDLRSDKTLHHGQPTDKYLIDDPLYAYFAVNACATVGMFLINYYEKKFPKTNFNSEVNFDDLPF